MTSRILTIFFLLMGLMALVPPHAVGAAEGQKSLNLKEAIGIALKMHPSVKQFQETVTAAQAGIGVSRAALLPQVNFQSDYFYGNAFARSARGTAEITAPGAVSQSIGITPQTSNFYIHRFAVNQLLYDFGKTPNLVAGSRASFNQAREDYSNTRQQVVLDARTAYFGLLAAQRALKVQEDTVIQNQDLVKQAQGFYQVGLKAKIDVTKAEANLYDAEAGLIKAKNAVDLARVTLMNALGLKAFPYTKVEDVLEVTYEVPSLSELKAQAMQQRPDLLKNRYQQDFNQAALKVAQAGYYPAFTSTAAYGWQGADYPLPSNWWVGAGVTFPLFEGWSTTYNVQQAKANIRSTEANAEVVRQNIVKEVEQAYLDLIASRELIRATAKAREAAQENWRLAQGRYKAGVGTIIEVTDAQVQFSQADLKFVQALYDYRVFEARLDKAVGRAF
jgi:outer membrane protein